ncbi:Por secretion system C-terminal sorting domain-containing protein [Dyadobacter soli]|uniref:Por secretion system C-terminal sorting domain-containing protein n=1 Tax=Dyadobacter soli TaxID=659014 RepID=A0A1G8BVF2_9BACT|nr:T9SS type A sorting domain-containing protein [Dyadobacter soli]SDH37171.1 Por secretion system C-terminal sorting domain-containing protein [Dyadobacter soli]
MKQNYTTSSRKGWISQAALTALLLVGNLAQAQEGSQGNTTIFGGAQMTFFSNHNFVTGGGGAQPGVILTERAAGNFGVLNFAGDNLSSTGASDAGYVDGYVRKYGVGQFVFPVGDNGFVGQFAASADGVMGAYFHADANTAVTSNLFTGTDYAALPAGGPFATSSMGTNVDVVSTVEYWDIDGANATPLTLTWDAGSAIGTLTNSQLNKLTIVGWNGTQWVAIPSKVDTTSVLGGSCDLTAGSITTISPLAPDTYTAYTFASLVLPLPVTLTRFTAAAESRTVVLNWSTTEESNSDRFDIERSNNGKQWGRIASVASQGDSKVLVNYSHVDASPLAGQNFYRLKMVDLDGTFAYSTIRLVEIAAGSGLVPYPNPVVDKILIRDHQLVKQADLHNASGVKVLANQHPSSAGIDVTRLPQGIYVITLTMFDGTISTHKVVITK